VLPVLRVLVSRRKLEVSLKDQQGVCVFTSHQAILQMEGAALATDNGSVVAR